MTCKFCGTNQLDKKKCKVCNEKICKKCTHDYAEYRSSGLKYNNFVMSKCPFFNTKLKCNIIIKMHICFII